MHTDYGGGVSEYADYRETVYNTGTDLNDGYNIYGIQFTPGVGVNYYFNGQLMFQQLETDPGGVVSNLNGGGSGTYEIILELQMATQGDSGWHTVPTAKLARRLDEDRRGAGLLFALMASVESRLTPCPMSMMSRASGAFGSDRFSSGN